MAEYFGELEIGDFFYVDSVSYVKIDDNLGHSAIDGDVYFNDYDSVYVPFGRESR